MSLYLPRNIREQQAAAVEAANARVDYLHAEKPPITTVCDLDEAGNRLPAHTGATWIPRELARNIPEYVWQRIPEPTGWRILVMEQRAPEQTEGGIILEDSSKEYHESLNYIGRVIATGPTAYRNKKFMIVNDENKMVMPEPWCALGDWITYRKYTGQPVKIQNSRQDVWTFRMVEDEWVDSVVPTPNGLLVYL